MLEPITLPSAMSLWPLAAATTEEASSGSEVPTATMVSPISSSDMPHARANAIAACTHRSEPAISRPSPPTMNSTVVQAAWVGCEAPASSSRTAADSRRDCWSMKSRKPRKAPSINSPSQRVMPPSSASSHSSPEAPSMIGTSMRNMRMRTTSGATSAEMPRMSPTLAMLLPTTLPIAMSVVPRTAADRLTASSGVEVPKPTITRPTTKGLIPKRTARPDAPRTNRSAPSPRTTRPRANQANCSAISPAPARPGTRSARRTPAAARRLRRDGC